MNQTSIARNYLNNWCYKEVNIDQFEVEYWSISTEQPYASMEMLFKIREEVAKLCQIWNTGTFDNPRDILISLKEAWVDIDTDSVGSPIAAYTELIEDFFGLCNDKGSVQLLDSEEYQRMIEIAKDEDRKWEEAQKALLAQNNPNTNA